MCQQPTAWQAVRCIAHSLRSTSSLLTKYASLGTKPVKVSSAELQLVVLQLSMSKERSHASQLAKACEGSHSYFTSLCHQQIDHPHPAHQAHLLSRCCSALPGHKHASSSIAASAPALLVLLQTQTQTFTQLRLRGLLLKVNRSCCCRYGACMPG